jgi:outer membrane protein assembly factor BamB
MWRRIFISALLAGLTFAGVTMVGGPLAAQVNSTGLISNSTANRYGLKRDWFTQVELNSARSRIAYMTMHVSATQTYTVFQIDHDNGKEYVTQRDRDAFGEPLGIEGAKKQADERVRKLKAAKLNPQLTTKVVPEITLYVTTDSGMLQAIDGETGQTRWTVPVGKSNHPTLEPAASDSYVAVVNGSVLIILDSSDGKLVWQRQMRGVPGAGPAITDDLVHMPTVSGMMESYALVDVKKPPFFFQSVGRALIQPTVTPTSVVWPTDRGHLYVGHANRQGSRYRLVAQTTISAPAAYASPNLLLVASVDGYVYCTEEKTGAIVWRYSTGESTSHPPVVIGDAVYVITERAGMFRVSLASGLEEWWTPNVQRFLSASSDRVYCLDELGRMLIVDAKSGGRIATLPIEQLDLNIINAQTDRIYLGTRSGMLQCLHETQLDWPLIYVEAGEEKKAPAEIQQEGLPDAAAPKPPAGVDPFGGGADPFGGAADPFGAPAKPAAPAPPADPFGADPFK